MLKQTHSITGKISLLDGTTTPRLNTQKPGWFLSTLFGRTETPAYSRILRQTAVENSLFCLEDMKKRWNTIIQHRHVTCIANYNDWATGLVLCHCYGVLFCCVFLKNSPQNHRIRFKIHKSKNIFVTLEVIPHSVLNWVFIYFTFSHTSNRRGKFFNLSSPPSHCLGASICSWLAGEANLAKTAKLLSEATWALKDEAVGTVKRCSWYISLLPYVPCTMPDRSRAMPIRF